MQTTTGAFGIVLAAAATSIADAASHRMYFTSLSVAIAARSVGRRRGFTPIDTPPAHIAPRYATTQSLFFYWKTVPRNPAPFPTARHADVARFPASRSSP